MIQCYRVIFKIMLENQNKTHIGSDLYFIRKHSTKTRGVDVTSLIKRVKDNNRKEKKKNLIFTGVVLTSVVVAGFIISF